MLNLEVLDAVTAKLVEAVEKMNEPPPPEPEPDTPPEPESES